MHQPIRSFSMWSTAFVEDQSLLHSNRTQPRTNFADNCPNGYKQTIKLRELNSWAIWFIAWPQGGPSLLDSAQAIKNSQYRTPQVKRTPNVYLKIMCRSQRVYSICAVCVDKEEFPHDGKLLNPKNGGIKLENVAEFSAAEKQVDQMWDSLQNTIIIRDSFLSCKNFQNNVTLLSTPYLQEDFAQAEH
eukprot:Gb_26987 [translate_table: standard]